MKKSIHSDNTGQLSHSNRYWSKTAESWKNASKQIYRKLLFERKKSFWPLVSNMKMSLLLIYPQSELLCVISLQCFSRIFRATKICIWRVMHKLHSCLGQFVSSGALHPVLYLIYSVWLLCAWFRPQCLGAMSLEMSSWQSRHLSGFLGLKVSLELCKSEP